MTFIFESVFLNTVESSSLGRLDYASLSQQALMEIAFDGIFYKEAFCGSKDAPNDIAEWTGITVNENGEVTRIRPKYIILGGSVAIEWLPSTVREIHLDIKKLSGTLNLETLPQVLETLDLSVNDLSGTLTLSKLPNTLKHLWLYKNRFDGSADLTNLPEHLKSIKLHYNNLSGPLDLKKLPSTLHDLVLSHNDFSGETDFRQLPKSLRYLLIDHNTNLSGKIKRQKGVSYEVKRGTKVTWVTRY